MNRIGLAAFVLLAILSQTLFAGSAADSQVLSLCKFGRMRQGADLDWLVRRDEASCRTGRSLLSSDHMLGVSGLSAPLLFQTNSGGTLEDAVSAPKTSAWKQAGIYGLEFAGAAVGTAVAVVASGAMLGPALNNRDKMWLGVAAFPTYAVSSALLSAGGTHLVGELLGHDGSFGHALAGGALGGLSGGVSLFFYYSSPGRGALVPIGLVLPPLCAVVVYNVWRSNDSW